MKRKQKSQSEEEWEVSNFEIEEEEDVYKVTNTTSLNDSSKIYTVPGVSIEEDMMSDKKEDEVSKSDQNAKGKRKLIAVSAQRSEVNNNMSEFNLLEGGEETVNLNEIIKTSQKLAGQDSVKKQLNKMKNFRTVSVPLSKKDLTKMKRTIAYDKVCDEMTRWEPIVNNNRTAEQTIFPLKKPDFQIESFEKTAEKYVTKHPVEIAVNELLKKSENVLKKENQMTEAEEKALKAMSLEEAKLRHDELMRHRALLSYQAEKARRQNKIKSKRYHRLLKKDKLKKLMKEFEELEKVDPAKALEKVMEADKVRILERMTLKHRNTGKWAKVLKLRAKYNPEARSALKEDLIIGRKLKEKLPEVDKTINKLKSCLGITSIENTEMIMHTDGLIEESGDIVPFSEMECEAECSEVLEDFQHLSKSNSFQRKHLQKETNTKGGKEHLKATSTEKASDFVDMGFISEANVLNSCNPSSVTIGDHLDEVEGDDEESEGIKNVSEAFADEDIIAEFREDKKAAEEANKPKGLDLYLPGWGSWGGKGIKVSENKKRRFHIAPLEEPAAKKSTIDNVIINENVNKKASVHQVSSLPFPFTNIHSFESYIRQPVGHTWNPPSSFKKLIEPKVVTKAGKVIEPIDADDVVLNETRRKPLKHGRKLKPGLKVF
ncbi:u3 small nucleolar RNA-associated protein 14 homolog A [Nephila pilipes]|uniref:U3 small nucleolar RNA-associated protein 14 homolog A n=1 Tax=Nephila pilipes TaxID=299642 RepID=A0A8X6R3J7_NEPPI|nr:u3 small nucleolar RNA-associated protein 14 homolog A [Nephila pilipes]